MIVVDTSAIFAILLDEPEAAALREILSEEENARISAVTDFEARLVAFRRGGQGLVAEYEVLFDTSSFSVETFGREEAALAFDAFRRFGKGNHPASLNLGDCAAYALAKNLDAPLLFKGNDFARTDVRRVL